VAGCPDDTGPLNIPNPPRKQGEVNALRILGLYIAREFLRLLFFLMLCFVSIYTIFDFIEKVDNFQEAGVAASTMLGFFILQIPQIASLMLPLAVLLATVISMGLMAKRNEIVAVKSSGISLIRFSLPLFLLSITLALGVTLLNETLIPRTKIQTNYIWNQLVEKRPGRFFHKENFWYKGQNSIYRIGQFDPAGQTLSNIVYHRFDADFNVVLRVDAKKASYNDGVWVFTNGLFQQALPVGGIAATPFERKVVDLPENPRDFSSLAKPSEEMGFGELAAFVRKVEKEGYDSLRYRVDLQAKLSFPFVCLIMCVWGIALALFKEKGRFLAPGVVLGMAVALSYWVSFSYLRSMFGYSGVLPPILAVWLPNGIFGLGGILMLTSVKQ
jgi:lipopolysaccharide export system permease protein